MGRFVTTAENDISKFFKAMGKSMYVCHNTSGLCAQVALGKLIAIDVHRGLLRIFVIPRLPTLKMKKLRVKKQ
jgi:plasmid rolling circle replication initiator protein Rep